MRPAAYSGRAGTNTTNKSFETAANTNFPLGALSYFTVPSYTTVTGNFPEAFAPPQPPGVARNSFNGPRYRDLDGSLTKAFGLPKMRVLGESAQFEFRVDAYNLVNNTNLNVGSINTNISNNGTTSNPSFGLATAALGSRTLDIQARFSF